MSLLNRNWCSNCMSSCCDCLDEDDHDEEIEIDEYPDEEPVSEKELWEAENKLLDKNS